MKKNKLLMIMLILLVAITLVGAVALVVVLKVTGEEKEPTIDEVLKSSVDVPQITTNLADDELIRISFKIQTDSKKSAEELTKRDFQVKNVIILELSEKKSEDLQGKEAQLKFEEELKNKITTLMQEGKVVKVYITEALLQ
ncbi:flagellar basal body-associated protein FliL [Bacillus sp. 31A1R]|uniref:Flagellar protein FliL n=1 Tax=Robertmurraya mangrovi TaxID=3098077 RepID=A0ABU5J232_9BACI|nr:flagellar basal body-associated protein FliL [Bacillus sp. 31A1R]MDZ5473474.1 flagellar basal body-associated protein FliL [Bacillus sp. 31A1R]